MKKKYFLLLLIFCFSVQVSAKDVQIYFITEGGSTNTSGFKIIDDYVNRTDGTYCATYKSNETIKTLNSINGASFSIYKNGTNQVSGREWYTYNYSNNKLYYFNQKNSYNVSDILEKLGMKNDYYPIISLFAHWKGDGVDGGIDMGGASSNSSTNTAKVKSISISGSSKISKGKSTTLKVTYKPSNAKKETIPWSSSNKKIASVNSSGKVTGISKGTVTITAKTSSGKEASIKISIVDKVIHYVNIIYDVNGGRLSKPTNKKISLSGSTIHIKKKTIGYKIPYNEKTLTSGLANYNNPKYINIVKSGFLAKNGEEWNTKADGTGMSFDQSKAYNARDFCDASEKDCTVTLYINWISPSVYCDNLVKSGVSSLDYKKFISTFSTNDDFYPIKYTHDCANKYNKKVIITKGVYNIYKKNTDSIVVKTDTDFNNSTIYIHDEDGIISTDNATPIYRIPNVGCFKMNSLSNVGTNNTVTELIGKGNNLVNVSSSNRKVFIRSGANENTGDSISESFRVNNNGKILDSIFWKYTQFDSVKVCPIPDNQLKFENANFYTIVDNSDQSKVSGYTKRGLYISRNNTILDNISHAYVSKQNTKSLVSKLTYRYYGFYNFKNVSDIVFKNSKVYALNGERSKTGNSTYDLIIDDVINSTFDGIRMYDYYNSDKYYNKSNQLSENRWGVIGSNRCKNMTFNHCVLNRIDSHRGIYNLTVNNSILGKHAFTLTGFGTLDINNVIVHYSNHFIKLRPDYGSIWNGTVNIKNSRLNPHNDSPSMLIYFKLTYDTSGNNKGYLHNYGYDLVLPNVNVSDFKLLNNTKSFSIFYNHNFTTNNDVLKKQPNGNLKYVRNNLIKNNIFKFSYPSSSNIKIENVTGNNSQFKVKKYYNSF